MLRSGLLVQLILVAGVALGQWPGQEGGKLPWWMDPNIIDFDPKPPRVPEADARSRFLFSQCMSQVFKSGFTANIRQDSTSNKLFFRDEHCEAKARRQISGHGEQEIQAG